MCIPSYMISPQEGCCKELHDKVTVRLLHRLIIQRLHVNFFTNVVTNRCSACWCFVKVRETLSRYLSIGVDQPLVLGAHLNGDESPW